MSQSLSPQKIYVAKSKLITAGRGVFANTNIKKGEVIEQCPIVKLLPGDMALLGESFLKEIVNFIAIRDIEKDEEIVVNYDIENSKKLWFKVEVASSK